MKANELMVGDWIADKQGDKVRVEDIVSDASNYYYGISVVGTHEGRCGRWTDRWSVPFEEAQPIPLTAEILEKNGFEESMSESKVSAERFGRKPMPTGVWQYSFGRFDSVSYMPERSFLRIKFMEGCTADIANIKYVHELQHALRLCGVEKEIEL